jgi:hypothetical protein
MTETPYPPIHELAESMLARLQNAGTKPGDFNATGFVHRLLAEYRTIAAIWSIEDVHAVRPALTDDQAWRVLQDVERHHDAELGIHWMTLKTAAEMLFGDAPDTDDAEEPS